MKTNELKERFSIKASASDYALYLAWERGIAEAVRWRRNNRGVVKIPLPNMFSPVASRKVADWRYAHRLFLERVRQAVVGQKVKLGHPVGCAVNVWGVQ